MALIIPGGLRIDHQGDGAWVMRQVKGTFNGAMDHVLLRHQGDTRLGGFVLCEYLGASLSVHMAGERPGWCTRTLLWMLFHYAFIQLDCHKMLTPVRSSNTRALEMDIRAGWRLEAIIRDAYAPGDHMLVLTMQREHCPWLRLKPEGWLPGPLARELEMSDG